MFPHIRLCHRLPVDLDRLFGIPQAQLGLEQFFGIHVRPGPFDRAWCARGTRGQFPGRLAGIVRGGGVDLDDADDGVSSTCDTG